MLKAKKVFSGVLSTVLLLGAFAVPGQAQSEEVEVQKSVQVQSINSLSTYTHFETGRDGEWNLLTLQVKYTLDRYGKATIIGVDAWGPNSSVEVTKTHYNASVAGASFYNKNLGQTHIVTVFADELDRIR